MYLALNADDASDVQAASELVLEGRYEAALDAVEDVKGAPAVAAALLVRARALTGLRRAPDALAAWRAVFERTPNNWKLYVEFAAAVEAIGADPAEARRAVARALELNPRLAAPDLAP